MKSRLGRVVAGTIALTAAAAALTSGTAFAVEPPDGIVWDHKWQHEDQAPGVVVYAEEHGDWIAVCDTSANGKSAWVQVFDRVGYEYMLLADGGKGSCDVANADTGPGYNLFEGDTIALNMDGNGDTPGSWYTTFKNDH